MQQMKHWESLLKRVAKVNRFNARAAAHQVADFANSLGMFTSDSLQLMINAAEYTGSGNYASMWLSALKAGHFVNEANGLNLSWMPSQFSDDELLAIGAKGVAGIKRDYELWLVR